MRRRTVAISEELAAELIAEASKHYPRETGGALLGIPEAGRSGPIVSNLVGAGPKAKREHRRFEPDGPWQRQQIARLYADSGRTLAYLGDWHSHPHGNGPSGLDHATGRKIAQTSAARCAHPLFLIVTRVRGEWELRAYRFGRRRFRRIALELT